MDSEEKTTSFIEILGSLLLFGLVFGMSATVDIHALQAQLHNSKALMTGLFLQFGCMPFLGFLVVRILRLRYEVGIVLLVLTSSPGAPIAIGFAVSSMPTWHSQVRMRSFLWTRAIVLLV